MSKKLIFLFCIATVVLFVTRAELVLADPVDRAGNLGTLLNEARAQFGQTPLKESLDLTAVAQMHADDMVRQAYFSHTGKDGSQYTQRIARQGFNVCFSAENISKGAMTAAETMNIWMSSPPHRQNNLHSQSTHYGVGVADQIWVLIIAERC